MRRFQPIFQGYRMHAVTEKSMYSRVAENTGKGRGLMTKLILLLDNIRNEYKYFLPISLRPVKYVQIKNQNT
jgi:hypothetical protein